VKPLLKAYELSCRSGGVVAVEVMGLPPMTSIAAGHSHCLMTDGQRVWAMGSWLLSNGKKVYMQQPLRGFRHHNAHSNRFCSGYIFRSTMHCSKI
jgi:hypothetical protein